MSRLARARRQFADAWCREVTAASPAHPASGLARAAVSTQVGTAP
jgi:hypothetical protein